MSYNGIENKFHQKSANLYYNYGNFCESFGGNHMPMIEAKVTMELPAEKRDVLKARKYGMNAGN